MRASVIVAFGGLFILLVGACAKPLSLEDRRCPCIDPGWVCCGLTCQPRHKANACSVGPDFERPLVPDGGLAPPPMIEEEPDAAEPEEPDAHEPEEPDAAEPEEPDAPESEDPDAGTVAVAPDATVVSRSDGAQEPPADAMQADGPPSGAGVSFTLPPRGGTVSGSLRLYAVSADVAIETLEVWVDGVLRNRATGAPTWIDWAAFQETLGAHPQAAHRLELVAIDRAGNRYRQETSVQVVAPVRGDCDSNGVLHGGDIAAAMSEATDGDAADPESTPGGSFLGSPACDANDDNVVDEADATCIRGLYYGPPGFACVSPDQPALRTILFLPVEYHHLATDDEWTGFMRDKVEEVRRFVARHNGGRTFRALPVEVFRAPQPRSYYFTYPSTVYENVLSEFLLGYVESSNKALTPWNRAVWVFVMGGSTFLEAQRYANGHSYALVGDAYLHAAKDLDCSRVNPVTPDDPVRQLCLSSWQGSGRIYGHSMGRAVQTLLASLGAPRVDPSSPDYTRTIMGDPTGYPTVGLTDADRAAFDISHFFPGSHDRSPAVPSILSPATGATVSGTVEIRAAARDNYGVRRVGLFIDDRPVHPTEGSWCPDSDECARSPFEEDQSALGMVYSWDTALTPVGAHSITFRTEDVSGNLSEAHATVTVRR